MEPLVVANFLSDCYSYDDSRNCCPDLLIKMDEVSILPLKTLVPQCFFYSSTACGGLSLSILVQSIVALQRLTLPNFTHAHFASEAHTLHLTHHPNADSLTQNYPNKITSRISQAQRLEDYTRKTFFHCLLINHLTM
jgi:hypothetical protein